MDTILTPFAIVGLIAATVVLAFCWLIYATHKGRPVKLNLEGLGIKLSIDQADDNEEEVLNNATEGV